MRLDAKSGGIALAVKVVPGSSRQRVAGEYAGGIKLTVTAPAHGGAANKAVIALLAQTLNIPQSNVQITRGHGSPRKEVLIVGLSADEIQRRLLPVQ